MPGISVNCRTLKLRRNASWLPFFAVLIASGPAAHSLADEKATAPAEEKAAETQSSDASAGRLIRVRLPLTGNGDKDTMDAIDHVVEQLASAPHQDGRRPIIVLE